MTRKTLILLAAAGSALLLAGAFFFQFLGYLPCKLCLWQRWPHAAAVVIGVVAYVVPRSALIWLGGLAAAVASGLGVYHTGVERAWWAGPASCTSSGQGLGGLSGGDLLALDGPALILCDQVAWSLLGLSMASWNAIASFLLVVVWIRAARRRA